MSHVHQILLWVGVGIQRRGEARGGPACAMRKDPRERGDGEDVPTSPPLPETVSERRSHGRLWQFIELSLVKLASQIISSQSLGAGPRGQHVLKLPQEILGQLKLGTSDLRCF